MKILWLKTELLHPVDKGGKIRTYQMLKNLSAEHEITYLTLDDGSASPQAREKAEEYCTELITIPHQSAPKFSSRFYLELAANAVSNLPYALQKYVSAEMRKAIVSALQRKEYDVLVCDFLAPAVNIPVDVNIPTVLFQHNVEAMIWRRHFETADGRLKRQFLRSQWRRMFEYEQQACHRFDRVVAVSKEDDQTMRNDYGAGRVGHIPTGVDTEYFRRDSRSHRTGNRVIFTGSMDWMPNEDAINWFVDRIWPGIREKVDDAKLTVVGRSPSPALQRLCQADPSVHVTGRVDDIRPYLSEADVFVVPIRVGGGTRLKIYEAMAMGLPVVSTTIGAEGLPLTNGVDILIRDKPSEFVAAVVELLADRAVAQQLASTGEDRVRREFGWAKVSERFLGECLRALLDRGVDAGREDSQAKAAAVAGI